MAEIDINTSQNVNIKFKVASIGERMLAYLLDSLIKVAYYIVVFLILTYVLRIENFFDTANWDDWSVRAVLVIISLPVAFYTLAFESMMEGQTIGKKIMNIKVVKIDGYQANFADYFMRWVFRLIDVIFSGGVVGLITMIVSKNNQRFGDIASGTAVISLKNKVNISHTILENLKEDYVPTFPQVIALNDNDVRIIKENFQKAMVTNDMVVIKKLHEKIRTILKVEIDDKMTEKQFINTIIKDYNYYTGKDA